MTDGCVMAGSIGDQRGAGRRRAALHINLSGESLITPRANLLFYVAFEIRGENSSFYLPRSKVILFYY